VVSKHYLLVISRFLRWHRTGWIQVILGTKDGAESDRLVGKTYSSQPREWTQVGKLIRVEPPGNPAMKTSTWDINLASPG